MDVLRAAGVLAVLLVFAAVTIAAIVGAYRTIGAIDLFLDGVDWYIPALGVLSWCGGAFTLLRR